MNEEIECQVCGRTFKNWQGLKTHYSMREDHIKYMKWLDYKDIFILGINKSIDDNYTQCKICEEYFKSIGHHISNSPLHKEITNKLYYDQFVKKADDGICHHPDCNNETKYIDINNGYSTYCSFNCAQNTKEVKIKQLKSFKLTLKNDPSITKKAMANRKLTYANNPGKKEEELKNMAISMRNKLRESDSDIPYFLYVVKHSTEPIIKIGRTGDIENRLKGLNKEFGKCNIIHVLAGIYKNICPLETYLHTKFNNHCQVQPAGGGRTEWFNESIIDEVLKVIYNV